MAGTMTSRGEGARALHTHAAFLHVCLGYELPQVTNQMAQSAFSEMKTGVIFRCRRALVSFLGNSCMLYY